MSDTGIIIPLKERIRDLEVINEAHQKKNGQLRQEIQDKALKELMIYEIAWEKKLELANGDLDTLAWLCCPDFSDIKKKSFWWTGVAQEQIDRLLKHYE